MLWNDVKEDLVQLAGTKTTPITLAVRVSEVLNLDPVPEFSDALNWPVIKNLLNTNRPVSEMEARFVRERPTIDREVSTWCARIKTNLADAVRESLTKHGCLTQPVVGTIANDSLNDPLQHIPPEIQLLIRADTIFAPHQTDDYRDSPKLSICGYEAYVQSLRQWIGYTSDEHWRPVSEARFKVHSTAPAIARALLGALGRPLYTTLLELEVQGEQFAFGKCNDDQPKSWLEMASSPKSLRTFYDHLQ